MTGLPPPLVEALAANGMAAFLGFLRIGAAMALLPAFGEQVVPMRVRLALGLAFTALILPAMIDELNLVARARPLVSSAAAEVIAGLALGLLFRLLVIALQVAGSIAANATSLAQIFGGGTGPDPQPAIGNLLVIAALALACAAGLHLRLVEALLVSYRLLPPSVLPRPEMLAQWAIGDVARTFALGFTLASPFAAAALIYNLALGAINRAMPQLMVAFVGAPALTAGGLVLMALSLPFLLSLWIEAMQRAFDLPFRIGD